MSSTPGNHGYYRYPTVHDDRIVFVSEDDLWEVELGGGRARRLTSFHGEVSDPVFSPDGSRIAFTGTEEGATEIFVIDARGGPAEQLIYNGSPAAAVGWSRDGDEVLFRSTFREPFNRGSKLYSVPAEGGEVRRLDYGQVHAIDFQEGGDGVVIGRHTDDLARWKRYRGGTAGALWIDPEGSGDWERLRGEQEAGIVRPMWLDGRVYFISDLEGYGNVYSCTPDGDDLTRHTDHEGFYARDARTDGETIVYSCGGRLYTLDVASGESGPVEVEYPSAKTYLNRKFVDASDYLHDYDLHPDGHSLAVTSRGKLFNFGLWEGAVRQNGTRQGVRYRLPRYLDDETIFVVSDEGGEESFELHKTDGGVEGEPVELETDEIGRPSELELSPDGDKVAFSTNRYDIVLADLESGDVQVLDRGKHRPIFGFDWSPDGQWIAYAASNGEDTSAIRVAEVETGEIHEVTSGEYRDVEPVFDPKGRYLYFLSCRKFNPVYDQVFFELSFPRTMKPCVVTLTDEEESPFFEEPRPLEGTGGVSDDGEDEEDGEDDGDEEVDAEAEEADKKKSDGDDDGDGEDEEVVEIDFEGIQSRVEAFPVPEGKYGGLVATEKRVFWTVHPIEGSLGSDWSDEEDERGMLKYYSLKKQEQKLFAKKVHSYHIGADGKTMALNIRGRLRVVNAAGAGPAQSSNGDNRPSRDSGWIDLDRVPVSVDPRQEWEQMLRESWRLMRDQFWRADMTGVDWEGVWERYSSLLDRVATRSEFSDLVWTMQGELGTSHAYEMGGDYPETPQYRPGFLGIDSHWDDTATWERGGVAHQGGYRIDHIVHGETWEQGASSPFDRPGVDVEEGDVIVAVNGQRLDGGTSLQESLVHRAGEEVDIAIAGDDETVETYTVELLHHEFKARYREWVRRNRERVHEATDGEIGYVHIPDMGPRGYAEFHRSFVSEQSRTGLVVDVRYNGGGHVSQLILEKLARERVGFGIQRWGKPSPYPTGSMEGPMVALTNEYAGSDGDIFSHAFKLMELGPLLGKRTWGGVVGIWPRHQLVDGSITTQPEFANWFNDVGYDLENHGTEPDQVVDDPPGSMTGDQDPQLDAAIERAREMLEENPPEKPDFRKGVPNMAPPDELP